MFLPHRFLLTLFALSLTSNKVQGQCLYNETHCQCLVASGENVCLRYQSGRGTNAICIADKCEDLSYRCDCRGGFICPHSQCKPQWQPVGPGPIFIGDVYHCEKRLPTSSSSETTDSDETSDTAVPVCIGDPKGVRIPSLTPSPYGSLCNQNAGICCSEDCFICGEPGCEKDNSMFFKQDMSDQCCQEEIIASGRMCGEYPAPCVLEEYMQSESASTNTPSSSSSPSPSLSLSPTPSATLSPTPSSSSSPTPSSSSSPAPSSSSSPTPSSSSSPTPSSSSSPTPSSSSSSTPSSSSSPTPSSSSSPTPSSSSSPAPSSRSSPEPSSSSSPTPSSSFSPKPSSSSSPTLSSSSSPKPSSSSSPKPSSSSSPEPSSSSSPTPSPSLTATPSPSISETQSPSTTTTPSESVSITPSPLEPPPPSISIMSISPPPVQFPTPSPIPTSFVTQSNTSATQTVSVSATQLISASPSASELPSASASTSLSDGPAEAPLVSLTPTISVSASQTSSAQIPESTSTIPPDTSQEPGSSTMLTSSPSETRTPTPSISMTPSVSGSVSDAPPSLLTISPTSLVSINGLPSADDVEDLLESPSVSASGTPKIDIVESMAVQASETPSVTPVQTSTNGGLDEALASLTVTPTSPTPREDVDIETQAPMESASENETVVPWPSGSDERLCNMEKGVCCELSCAVCAKKFCGEDNDGNFNVVIAGNCCSEYIYKQNRDCAVDAPPCVLPGYTPNASPSTSVTGSSSPSFLKTQTKPLCNEQRGVCCNPTCEICAESECSTNKSGQFDLTLANQCCAEYIFAQRKPCDDDKKGPCVLLENTSRPQETVTSYGSLCNEDEGVCCEDSCAKCTGENCGHDEDGQFQTIIAQRCCAGYIKPTKRLCNQYRPPCVIP